MKDEVDQILHMVGGLGETSYATNSTLQAKAIYKAKSVVQKCTREVYSMVQPEIFVAADLGCSSGPTTFMIISEIMEAIHEISCRLSYQPPELMFFLNDLPGNDFNTLFKSLTNYKKKVRAENATMHVPYYVAGAPGSFYERLFPKKSVHFMHSSSSLHWLSQVNFNGMDLVFECPRVVFEWNPSGITQVPAGLDSGTPINKGNIYIDNTSLPTVSESYLVQFQQDFSTFLKLRSNEIISGGQMVLTFLGRSKLDPASGEMNHLLGLLAKALNSLVSEGVLEQEKVDAFDLPVYAPAMEEVKAVVLNEGSFELHQVHTFELNWDPYDDYNNNFVADYFRSGVNTAKTIRAALEPILASHFGYAIMDSLFSRYAMNVAQHLKEQKTKFVNFIIALKKRL